MNKREQELILSIYKDRLSLQHRGELTEFGRGQLYLCKLLLGRK